MLAHPTLVWLHEALDVEPSVLMQLFATIGVVVALLGAIDARWRSALPMALLWILYLSIVQCGQTFMQFQWDSFLLEVGFLSIWLAPWWTSDDFKPPQAVVWNLRFLFFKFMLMSGAVKIQARCPTWLELTALDFHYATQPLPLPLAWYAHQIPPIINRIAVAFTLMTEGPWTFLLLAPHLTLRRLGAAIQVLLQIGIMLTGNYNFFNLMTVLMACTVLDIYKKKGVPIEKDLEATSCNRTSSNANRDESSISKIPYEPIANLVDWLNNANDRFQTHHGVSFLVLLGGIAYCVYSWLKVIEIVVSSPSVGEPHTWDSVSRLANIHFRPSVDDVQAWLATILPRSIMFAGAVVIWAAFWQCASLTAHYWRQNSSFNMMTSKRSRGRFIVLMLYLITSSLASAWVFTSSSLTLASLDHPFQRSLPSFVPSVYLTTQAFRITSAYGLFRRMTGVGVLDRNGQQYTVVARPEIIMEGTDDAGQTWKPYHFKYKPGDLHDRPRLAMPFQPRLDWQMWFAALNDYKNTPWIVHLVAKLLEGSSDVKQLLDSSRDPFPWHPPDAIRCNLYYYDFTRANSSWNRELPIAEIVSVNSSQWWTRTFAHEYLPVLERGNPSLAAFVGHHWPQQSPISATSASRALIWLCEDETAPLWLVALVLALRSRRRDLAADRSKLKLRREVDVHH